MYGVLYYRVVNYFFQMKNLFSKIVDYNNGKEIECVFEF